MRTIKPWAFLLAADIVLAFVFAVLVLQVTGCKTAPRAAPVGLNPSAIQKCSYNDEEHCGQYRTDIPRP